MTTPHEPFAWDIDDDGRNVTRGFCPECNCEVLARLAANWTGATWAECEECFTVVAPIAEKP